MTVKARLNRRDIRLNRRRRLGRSAHPVTHRDESAGTMVQAEVRGVHEGGPPQDQALYMCQCGFAFEAPVSTSVDCPHCGTVQAW